MRHKGENQQNGGSVCDEHQEEIKQIVLLKNNPKNRNDDDCSVQQEDPIIPIGIDDIKLVIDGSGGRDA